jgi:hypothetical protein
MTLLPDRLSQSFASASPCSEERFGGMHDGDLEATSWQLAALESFEHSYGR